MSITNGGVDYAIEASALTDVIEQAFKAVRQNGGLCVFASHPKHGNRIQIDPLTSYAGNKFVAAGAEIAIQISTYKISVI